MGALFIEIESLIGELIQREANVAKPIGQFFEDIVQIAAARSRMRSDQMKIGAANLLVKI